MKLTRRQFFRGLLASTALVAAPSVVALAQGKSPNQSDIDSLVSLIEHRIKRAEEAILSQMSIDLYGDSTSGERDGLYALMSADPPDLALAGQYQWESLSSSVVVRS